MFVLAAATVPVPHRETLTDASPTRGRLVFEKEYHSVETRHNQRPDFQVVRSLEAKLPAHGLGDSRHSAEKGLGQHLPAGKHPWKLWDTAEAAAEKDLSPSSAPWAQPCSPPQTPHV